MFLSEGIVIYGKFSVVTDAGSVDRRFFNGVFKREKHG
jgi:hypothetical protein